MSTNFGQILLQISENFYHFFAQFYGLILQIQNLSYITFLDISYRENLK